MPGEDKVMSKLSSLETRFIRNLSKEKCHRYRFPAIVMTLISAGMMLLLLFVVEVELVDGPGAIVEIDTQGTMYYIISDIGAESSLAEGALVSCSGQPRYWQKSDCSYHSLHSYPM